MQGRPRKFAIAAAGAAAVIGAGTAIGVAATSGGGSPSEAFADALSDRVGTTITPEQVEQARQDVLRERLGDAVARGRLSQAQADRMLEWMAEASARHEARRAAKDQIAEFLGVTPEELHRARHDGTTLAQLAEREGKTRAALVAVIKKAITDSAALAGIDPPEAADLQDRAEALADGEGHMGRRGLRGHGPGFRGPGFGLGPPGP